MPYSYYIPPDGPSQTLDFPWTHSLALPKHQLCDGAPLCGNDGSIGDGFTIEIDDLTDIGYAIEIINLTSKMVPTVTLIQP